MKHAFLIYAHDEPLVLHTLLRLLDHERNEIFLHLDPRNSVLPSVLSPSPLSRAKLHLLTPAQRVSWGDYSQIEVELRLFAQALRVGPFAHYHLISGVDLPIKPMAEIHAFFDAHPTTEFLGFWNDEVHQRDLERRTHRYYFFTQYLKRAPHKWRHRFTVPLRNVSLAAQKIINYRRHRQQQFHKGFNWCSLTHDCVTWLLEQQTWIQHTFRHMLAPDEIYKQTLIAASPFAKNIYDRNDPERGTMRRIDWTRGRPYVWQTADIDELMAIPHLFARKFDAPTAIALAQRLELA